MECRADPRGCQRMSTPKIQPTKIHLDVDGVLADWTASACRLFDRDPEDVNANWPDGVWELATVLGISKNKLWRAVDAAGAEFWANLELFPWSTDLVALCQSLAPTTLLTSPSRHPSSHEGKFRWIARHFGEDFTNYLIGPDKVAAASPYSVLIDDRAAGLDRYCEGPTGGHAILFPAAQNELAAFRLDPMAIVGPQLRGLFG